MNMTSFFSRLRHSPFPRRAAVTLLALAWGSLAFCGEIHEEAQSGDIGMVKVLLKGNPDLVFSKDKDGHTPLHLAAWKGHKDVAELLLANKADVNAKDNLDRTPLYYAVRYGHRDMVELLLGNKAEVSAKNELGETPLHLAAEGGHKDIAELLLTNSADVNAKDVNGWTPLHYAAQIGNKEVAELLLGSKAEINAKTYDGCTPLHYAAMNGNKEVAKLLLSSKAEVNAKNNRGYTPLYFAEENGHKDMTELLRGHGGHGGGDAAAISISTEKSGKPRTSTAPNTISLVSGSNGGVQILGGLPLISEDFSYDVKLRRAVPSGGQVYQNTIIDLTKLPEGTEVSIFDINVERDLGFKVPFQRVWITLAGGRRYLFDDNYTIFPDGHRTVSPGGPFVTLHLVVTRLNGEKYEPVRSVHGILKREAGRVQAFETDAGGVAIIELKDVREAMVSAVIEDASGGKQEFPIPLPIKSATKGIVKQIAWPTIGRPK